MVIFGQRDARWRGVLYGWGPARGTIGDFGCLLTDLAMICWDSFPDMHYTPAALNGVLIARKVYQQDPSGTYDLIPSIALDMVWPARFKTAAYAGFRGDLIGPAVASADTYAIGWISTPSVPTHFVIFASRDGKVIIDPWTGARGLLAGYGGPGAIHRTILVRKLPPPKPAPAPPAKPPPAPAQPPEPAPTPLLPTPIQPEPVPLPTPPPEPPGGWPALWAWIVALIRSART